ncbi:MAG: PA domain-containing protein [Kofleriaceae bacterium]
MRGDALRALTIAAGLVAAPALARAGQIIIVNADGPNEGFNDPTPATPIGGNPGTTRGAQRLQVFERAAAIWADALRPTNDILVLASFDPLAPNVLGSAGTTAVFADFPGAEFPDTWYPSALADQLAGADLNPGAVDIRARFSSNFTFYFGFDNNEGALVDLLPVVLHELGHGLGFANFVDETTGALFLGRGDVYSQYTLDVTTDRTWTAMTDAQRQASAINLRRVSWNGRHVNQAVPEVLLPGEPALRVAAPSSLGALMVGPAAFGAPLTEAGVTGQVALATDGISPVGDGCSPIVSDVAGKVALLDRGTCAFTVKVKNAQLAGAIAVLVADNAAGGPPAGLGGVDASITIPAVRITLADGVAVKAALAAGPITVTLGIDTSILAGTDRIKHLAMLAALDPVAPGSSISHFEAIAFRNLLMEPAINPDLTSSVRPPQDLTLDLMTDIGWFSDRDGVPDGADACLGSDPSPTVVIAGCDAGVTNTVFADGCRISDQVDACLDGAATHGAFVSCVAQLGNRLRAAGVITGAGKGALQACAARAP